MTGATSGAASGRRAPGARRDRRELVLHGLAFAAIGVVCHAIFLHPTEMLYSPVSDLLAGHHPYRMLQRQALAAWGRITLWDPTAFGGIPLVSDPQAGLFYPPWWLQWLLPLGEGEAGYGWGLVLHLLCGAFGMLFWLRDQGCSRPARLAGALVFVFSGKLFSHVVVQGHIVFLPLLWLPWQCALIDRVIARPTPRRIALLAIFVALMVIGTHPQLLLYALLLLGAYALAGITAVRGESAPAAVLGRRGLALGAAAALALSLVAVFLLPVVDGSDEFVRGDGFGYAEAARHSLSLRELQGLLLPVAIAAERAPSIFVGSLATVLSLFALWDSARRRNVIFHATCIGLLVWHAMGDAGGLYRLLFEHVPGFDLFRLPSRSLLLLGLPLGALAASGLEVLCEGESSRGQRRLAIVAFAAGLLLFAGQRQLDGSLAALALAVPAACLLVRRAGSWPALGWALALVVCLDQARLATPLVRTRPLAQILGENPVVELLAAPIGRSRVLAFDARRAGDRSSLPIAYATRAGIETLRGFNPLIPEATAVYLYTGAAGGTLRGKHATTIETFEIASRAHLDLFNVCWLVTNQPLELEGLALRARFGGLWVHHFQSRFGQDYLAETRVYENPHCFPRAALVRAARPVESREQAIREIGRFDPRELVLLEGADAARSFPGEFRALPLEHRGDELELELDAGAGGFLVLSEVWFRGWHAEVDGQPLPILRANGVFRALELGPGPHHVRLWYRPRSYAIGRIVSGLALGISLLLIGWPRARPADAA